MSGPIPDHPDPLTARLVGVGPGPVDLLTVRATRLIARCDACLYLGPAVPREVLALCPPTVVPQDVGTATTPEVAALLRSATRRGDRVVLLLPGEPEPDGELAELTAALDADGIPWQLDPGVRAVATVPERSAAAVADEPAQPDASGPSPRAPRTPAGEPGRILVLGGTGDARRLADLMVTAGLDVVTSLAGRVARPRLPRGEVRIGDFGGPDGLALWLLEHDVSAVIDATDPFATTMSADAARATGELGVPLLRLHRPPWTPTDGDDWIRVPDMDAAARVVRERFRRPLLTVGRRGPSAFADDTRGSYLIRCVEPPPGPLPHRYLLVLDRGPFDREAERTLMSRHRIDVLVTRNSGGRASVDKLRAANDLRIPVVMVERPDAVTDAETVTSVDDAARWLVRQFGSR